MTRLPIDLKPLRRPLAMTTALLLACLLAAAFAWHTLRQAQAALDSARTAYSQQQSQAKESAERAREHAENTLLAAQLSRAIANPQSSTEISRRLSEIQMQQRLPALRSQFGKTTPLNPRDHGPYRWQSTRIDLELRLLHEADLLAFMSALTDQATLLVEHCRLQSVHDERSAARLSTHCEVNWLHISGPET